LAFWTLVKSHVWVFKLLGLMPGVVIEMFRMAFWPAIFFEMKRHYLKLPLTCCMTQKVCLRLSLNDNKYLLPDNLWDKIMCVSNVDCFTCCRPHLTFPQGGFHDIARPAVVVLVYIDKKNAVFVQRKAIKTVEKLNTGTVQERSSKFLAYVIDVAVWTE